MAEEQEPEEGQRWTAKRRAALVISLLMAETTAAEAARRQAVDLTHVPCGADGWGHLTAVIDCHDREVPGFEFALRGRAKEAERALEEACLARFGSLRPHYQWIEWYNAERPHQALGYRSPRQFRALQLQLVA